MKPKLLAVSLLLAAPFLSGQSPVPATSEQAPSNIASYQDLSSYTLKQEVRNVVVDVTVTDKHGQPIQALDKSRFQIFENGVPQDIALFEEHKGDETTPVQPAPNLPPDTHSNFVSAPAGPLIVLFLDALNTPPGTQSYVRGQALEYLKKIPAGTHMAIFSRDSPAIQTCSKPPSTTDPIRNPFPSQLREAEAPPRSAPAWNAGRMAPAISPRNSKPTTLLTP